MNIVKNKAIKEALQRRWKELDIIKQSDIVKDAEERAPEMKINNARLSKWLKDYKHKGNTSSLSETQVLWLLTRWGIPISLNIGYPKLFNGKLKFEIPKYDELAALKMLKQVFPKEDKQDE